MFAFEEGIRWKKDNCAKGCHGNDVKQGILKLVFRNLAGEPILHTKSNKLYKYKKKKKKGNQSQYHTFIK